MVLRFFSQIGKIDFMCWKCGKPLKSLNISRTSVCPNCGSDLHVCRACVFYSVGSHYDCHETIDEVVRDKEKANFCEYFKCKIIGSADTKNNDKMQNETDKARDAFNSLFS